MLPTRGLTTAATPKVAEVQVIRRDGCPPPLNLDQIRSVVDWACEGLDANPMTLEARLTNRLSNGLTTREIPAQLINSMELLHSFRLTTKYDLFLNYAWNQDRAFRFSSTLTL